MITDFGATQTSYDVKPTGLQTFVTGLEMCHFSLIFKSSPPDICSAPIPVRKHENQRRKLQAQSHSWDLERTEEVLAC